MADLMSARPFAETGISAFAKWIVMFGACSTVVIVSPAAVVRV
jgi:hypothetical protein